MSTHIVCMLIQPAFKPWDKPPNNYLAWHEWAEVQRKAGITQKLCKCEKWITPQEIEDHYECVRGD